MLIVYDSKTGNVQRFIHKLGMECVKITDHLMIGQPFILVTYTTGMGQVPKSTHDFLERNSQFLRAVAASGNMNWGTRYALAGDQIANQHSVPLLLKFELSGTSNDVNRFKQGVQYIVEHNTKLDTA